MIPPLPYLPDAAPKGGRPGHGRGFGSGGGRRPGSKSKVSLALKEAILLAAELVGDKMADEDPERQGGLAGYLEMVAATDIKSFCGLLGRVLPMTIAGSGEGGGIVVEIVKRTYAAADAG